MSANAAFLNSMVSVDIPSGQGIANDDHGSVEASGLDDVDIPVVAEPASTSLSIAASGQDDDVASQHTLVVAEQVETVSAEAGQQHQPGRRLVAVAATVTEQLLQ